MSNTLRDQICDLLTEVTQQPTTSFARAAPLELDSFAIVRLHDLLEQRFAIRIRAREVTPEAFGSLTGLIQLISKKLEDE